MIIKDTELHKINGEKIVLAGGCFDIIHPGHIKFLQKAKNEGNILVILLESDENIRKLKGETRPMNNQITRAENLFKTTIVDYIILLRTPESSNYYYNLVKLLKPDIIAVTKDDPLFNIKEEQARMVGGQVKEVMIRDIRFSTSKIVERKKI